MGIEPVFCTLITRPFQWSAKKSAIDCFQIRAVSHKRMTEKIGIISAVQIQLIKKSIALILDIDPEDCE